MIHSKAVFSLQSEHLNTKISAAKPYPITIPLVAKHVIGICGPIHRNLWGVATPSPEFRSPPAIGEPADLRAAPSRRKIADFKK
jgi:hypothetical protein